MNREWIKSEDVCKPFFYDCYFPVFDTDPVFKRRSILCSKFEECFNLDQSFHSTSDSCNYQPTRKCLLCDKNFMRKNAVLRHIEQAHKKTLQYECHACGSKYRTKYALKRHIETAYLSFSPYTCTVCKESFRLSNMLSRHLKKAHPDVRSFKCTQCFATFKMKGDLQRHIDRIHSVPNDEKPPQSGRRFTCILCDKAFAKKTMILFHLENDHSIPLAFETHNFANIDEFHKWKDETEKKIVCQYIKVRCDKNKKCTILSFMCHRSGVYQTHAKKNMRRLKLQGSKKMNGFCPAEMSLRLDKESGSCILTHLKTHIGHPTADETELAHIYLSKEEKRKVAEKIAVGTSFDEILNDLCASNGSDKLRLLDNHDLHNIASSYNLKVPRRTKLPIRANSIVNEMHSEITSFQNVDEFIKKYSDSVLYFKKENELDVSYPRLRMRDVIIVIMSETQRSMLQKFGHNAIAVGGFYKDESYDFYIQTLLVVDNYSEAFVCAFAVSNRSDEDIIDIFLHRVRENVATLCPKCLITDTRDIFYKSWSDILGSPEHSLLCSWHVKQTLKNKLQYISNKEKQRLVKEKLDRLCVEPDEHEFLTKLKDFFNLEDSETERFFEFFRHNFVKNVNLWAHCYRLSVDSNANVYMESFHNFLKLLHGKSKKCKRFCDILNIFEEHLQFKERLLKIKEIRGRLSNKLRSLRRRHDYALRNSEKVNYSMEKNEVGDWVLYSLSVANDENVVELFSVQCVNQYRCPVSDDCKLICEKCEVCAHQYKCSCNDSSIKNNMCHHVHTVCLRMKGISSLNSDHNELFLIPSLDMNVDNMEDKNQVELIEVDSSHMAVDFSNEILNSPGRARTLSENVTVAEMTASFSTSVSNELESNDLNDLVEIPFCDVIELEGEKSRLKEALMSAVAVVETASSVADLCFIKEIVTPAILLSSVKKNSDVP